MTLRSSLTSSSSSSPMMIEITTLSPLPLEVQDIIFDMLKHKIPVKMIRLSKQIYEEIIPRIYHTTNINDDNYKGVFYGLLDQSGPKRKENSLRYMRDLTFEGEQAASGLMDVAGELDYPMSSFTTLTDSIDIFPKLEHLCLKTSVFRGNNYHNEADKIEDDHENGNYSRTLDANMERACMFVECITKHFLASNVCIQIHYEDDDGKDNDHSYGPCLAEQVHVLTRWSVSPWKKHTPRPSITLDFHNMTYDEMTIWFSSDSQPLAPYALRVGSSLSIEQSAKIIANHHEQVMDVFMDVNSQDANPITDWVTIYYVDLTEDLEQALEKEWSTRGITADQAEGCHLRPLEDYTCFCSLIPSAVDTSYSATADSSTTAPTATTSATMTSTTTNAIQASFRHRASEAPKSSE